MTLQITMQQSDITLGVRRACFNCPVSLAVAREYRANYQNKRFHVTVTERIIEIYENGLLVFEATTPEVVSLWIVNFDQGITQLPLPTFPPSNSRQ